MTALILAAGFETTTGLLANGFLTLLRHPHEADRLRREPALAKPAAEELLRYDTPVQVLYGRTATQDMLVGERRGPRRPAADQPARRRQPRPAPVLRARPVAP